MRSVEQIGVPVRAGFDVLEAHCLSQELVFGKLVRMDISNDGQVIARGLEVLPEGENVRTLRGKLLHGGANFVFFFA